MIKRNVVACVTCGQQVHNKGRCRCGSVEVFGGTQYLGRIAESESQYLEMSEFQGCPTLVFQSHQGYRLTRRLIDA